MTKPLSTTEVLATVVDQVAKQVTRATLSAARGHRSTPAAPTPVTPPPVTPPRRAPLTMADLTAEQREHMGVCVHEASHAVAGVVLGAPLFTAVVSSGKYGTHGKAVFDEFPPGTDPLVTYAGCFGQAKFEAGGRRPTQRALFALFDRNGRCDRDALGLAGGTHLGHDVQPIIDRCWPAVIRVAQQLHRSGEVSHADVCAALGITDGGGRTSAQLAGLRSGCRSVPPITKTKRPIPA